MLVLFLNLFLVLGALDNPADFPYTPPDRQIVAYIGDSTTPFSGSAITVPYDASRISFMVTQKPGFNRYELEGLDEDWNVRTGEMYFGIRFIGADGNEMTEKRYLHEGRSPGWVGTLQGSTFIQHTETISVPPGARRISLFMTSAGPASCVGEFAVYDVLLTRAAAANGTGEILLSSDSFLEGKPPLPGQSSPQWRPAGPHPSMAKITRLNGPGGSFGVFEINDNDIFGHADWYSVPEEGPLVIPGETLTLRWKETHSIGMGDAFLKMYYIRVPPGHYRFKVEHEDIFGPPVTIGATMLVNVPLPYWKNPWFLGGCAIALATLAVIISWLVFRMNAQRRLARARIIDEERMRIARDLHDNLGARLSEISLTSSHSEQSVPAGEARQCLHEIADMALDLSASVSEVVWMLNPKNDNLPSLADFLARSVSTVCARVGVHCYLDIPRVTDDVLISSELRHNVSLAVREAAANAIKHGRPGEIRFQLRHEAGRVTITIIDDGAGFQEQPASAHGNGIPNMRQRMATLHGVCRIDSAVGRGTRVHLEFPVSPPAGTNNS